MQGAKEISNKHVEKTGKTVFIDKEVGAVGKKRTDIPKTKKSGKTRNINRKTTRKTVARSKTTRSKKHRVRVKGKTYNVSDKAWMYYIHNKDGNLDELSPKTRREYRKAYKKEIKTRK